ncbi:GTPase family protein [Crocosphaera sp.]|uniref:GTPase family protein n=1 Tax=Crocosphaera sp. TaxID=2729996 RepID=UPI003F25EF11|nr:50S ribosome-binding GTPase [Crocosphaera sp.]
MNQFVQSTKNFLKDKLLLTKIPQWFQVSDEQIAEILETVREKLPTTEAILIGKTQSGKSSIVRGLTGVSAEIVGEGFRPHTKHTQQYTYPNDDLPLLIFTDTVGLGDVQQHTESIIQELTDKLQTSNYRARVVILTVKINDFATETLAKIAQELRQLSPNIPYLLVVTCLHELYPSSTENHPTYPPNFKDINRAFNQIKKDFKGLYDEAILIDFTLEEDGYTPIFYGLETLRDSIAQQLPEAESVAIYQLLEGETTEKIGNLYRDVARRYIWAFSVAAATLAAVPLPFATMPVLTALQVSQVTLLGKLYGQILTPSQAGGIVSAIAGGFLAQSIGRELIKFIPGLGSIIAASWAGAYTWALGEGACVYFGDLMGGKKPNPDQIQAVMQAAFKQAQTRFEK